MLSLVHNVRGLVLHLAGRLTIERGVTKTPSDLYCATTGGIIVSRGRRGTKDIDSLFSFLRRSVLDPVGAINFYETKDDRKLNFEHARIMRVRCQPHAVKSGLKALKA